MAEVRKQYWINFRGAYRQVFPRGTNKSKIVEKQENDQIFYRRKWSGKISFIDSVGLDDFTFFKSIELSTASCEEIKFEVRKLCSGSYVLDWKGYFTTTQGSFDFDKCTFTIEPKVDDEYRCILENWEKQINILDVPTDVDTTAFVQNSNFEYYFHRGATLIAAGNTATVPAPLTSWGFLHYVNDGDPNGAFIAIWYRQRIVTTCASGVPQPPTGSGWILLTDNCATLGTAIYVRQPIGSSLIQVVNPNVLAGTCVAGVATLPPTIARTVTIHGPVGNSTVNDINGRTIVCSHELNIPYEIDAPTSSTLLWTLSALGSIASGQGTKHAVVNFATTTINQTSILRCIETTVCGDIITHELLLHVMFHVISVNQFGDYHVIGPTNICLYQTNIVFKVDLDGTIATNNPTGGGHYIWTVPVSLVIISGQGTDTIVCNSVTSGTGAVKVKLYPANCFTGSLPVTTVWTSNLHPVNVSSNPNPEPITGLLSLCASSTGCHYKIPVRSGAVYTWVVTGGAIVSGQGTEEVVVDWDGTIGDHLITVDEVSTCGCHYNLIVDCGASNDTPYYWCDQLQGESHVLGHNRYLMDAIEYLFNQSGCQMFYEQDLISDFFERNPLGDVFGYVAGVNYVTGQINRVNLLTIAQKSDILCPTCSNPASLGEMTFKRMMEILRELFVGTVYWYLVPSPSGKFYLRIEHDKYFNFSSGLNTTVAPYKNQVDKMSKYDHLADELPKYERFKFMEAANPDFIGADIIYESLSVSQDPQTNVLTHNLSEITTDIEEILVSPGDISKEGFAILANEDVGGGVLQVIVENGLITGSPYANAHLSWANLHYNYGRYRRILSHGKMNNVDTPFITFKPTIRQTPLTFTFCCEDFDANLKVTTELGRILGNIGGQVESSEIDIMNDTMKLILLYSFDNCQSDFSRELREDNGIEFRENFTIEMRD